MQSSIMDDVEQTVSMARREIATESTAQMTPNAQVINIQVPSVLSPSRVVNLLPTQSDSRASASFVSFPPPITRHQASDSPLITSWELDIERGGVFGA